MSANEDQTLSLPANSGGASEKPREDLTLSHPGAAREDAGTLSLPAKRDAEGTLSHPGQQNRDAEGTLSHPGGRERATIVDKESDALAGANLWQVGDLVDGKYDVTGIIGKGGMGIVYKVLHREWNIEMAVKTPLPNLVKDAQARARFFREAQTWVDLGLHPNIVQCWYVRELDGLPRVFADYISGGSLKQWCQNGNVPPGDWAKIIDLVVQACDGLDYAHERGAVHRDVKPGNLLMTPDGRLCVTDFGLVKLAGVEDIPSSPDAPQTDPKPEAGVESTMLTMTGSVLGTPEYGAPEQWGEARHVDARADIYALGIVMYEMCCGRRPFDDGSHRESVQAIIGRHLSSAAPDPRGFRPDLPERLAQLCLKCLAKKPEQRPQSMRAMRDELAEIYGTIFGQAFPRAVPKATEARAAALNNRAVSMWDLSQPDAALAGWQEALKLDPHHPEALYNKSLLEWRSAKITDLDAEERLRAVNDPQRRARFYLGLLNMERLATKEAEAEIAAALEHPSMSEDGSAWRTLGHAQMAQEKFDEAKASYGKALQKMDRDLASREGLALAQGKSRKKKDAIVFPSRHCVRTIDKHSGSMRALAITPDGRHILGARGDFMLCLWELPWGTYIRGFSHPKEINAVVLTPDGKRIVTGGGDADLHFWDIGSERPLDNFYGRGHVGSVRALAMDSEGAFVLSAGTDKSLRLWRIPDGALIATYRDHEESIEAIEIMPDGKYAVSAGDDMRIRYWDLNAGRCATKFDDTVRKKWRCLAVTPDGKFLFAGGSDGTLGMWDAESFQFIKSFKGHSGTVLAVKVTPDGKNVISGGDDRTMRLWDIQSGRCLRTFTGHTGPVQCLALTPDGRAVFSGALENQNQPLRLWDMALEKSPKTVAVNLASELRDVNLDAKLFHAPLVVCKVESQAATQAAQQQFETLLSEAKGALQRHDNFAAYQTLNAARAVPGYERDPQAMALNAQLSQIMPRSTLTTGYPRLTVDGHLKGTRSLAFSANQKFAVSAGRDDSVARLWDVASGTCVGTFEGHKRAASSLAITGDNRYLVTGSDDDTLRVWELKELGKCLRTLEGHKNQVFAAAISKDNRLILSGSYDRTVALWDLSSGRRVRTFEGHAEPVTSVAFSSDGRTAVSGSREGAINLWSLATGARLKTFEGHIGEIHFVAVTSKGRVVSAGEDKLIRIWNAETGACENTLKGGQGAVHALALTPDGRFIFSGGMDGPDTVIHCWELVSGKCAARFGVHPKGVRALALAADACSLISGGEDAPIRFWDLEWQLEAGRTTLASIRPKTLNPFGFGDEPRPRAGASGARLQPAASPPSVPPPPPPPPPPPAAPNAIPQKPKRRGFAFDENTPPPKAPPPPGK